MSYRILKKANSSFPAAMIALTLWAIKKKRSSQHQQRLHNNIILPKEDHIIDSSIVYLITCGFCNTQNNHEICVISQGPKAEADNITKALIILVITKVEWNDCVNNNNNNNDNNNNDDDDDDDKYR